MHVPLVVLGGGPGGYAAAFLAADLGLEVTLVEQDDAAGRHVPAAGLHPLEGPAARRPGALAEAREMADWGIHFPQPTIDIDALRARKEKVIATLTGGLAQLARGGTCTSFTARPRFTNSHDARAARRPTPGGASQTLTFDHCILASGSRPARIPAFDLPTPRVMDSTGALELADVPESLLVIGGGYIGLEMGTVYAELGCRRCRSSK